MGIELLQAGLFCSVQDLGRPGYQRLGVPVSGAMDRLALRTGNLLLRNADSQAALEYAFLGPTLAFHQATWICITGADFHPSMDGQPLETYKPYFVRKGAVLDLGRKCGPHSLGCRAYLCVRGGFRVPEILGSRATSLVGSFGGYMGRYLQRGDRLPLETEQEPVPDKDGADLQLWGKRSWSLSAELRSIRGERPVRVMWGPEGDWFDMSEKSIFLAQVYEVEPASDRMGLRLQGRRIHRAGDSQQMLSSAVSYGTIQVPADGKAILLMADHQATGGYPRIAQVAQVDLPYIGQLGPGDKIRFTLVGAEEAWQALQDQEQALNRLQVGLSFQFNEQ